MELIDELIDDLASSRCREDWDELIEEIEGLLGDVDDVEAKQRYRTRIRELEQRIGTLPSRPMVLTADAIKRRVVQLQAVAPVCKIHTNEQMVLRCKSGQEETPESYFWGCRRFPGCWSRKKLTTELLEFLAGDAGLPACGGSGSREQNDSQQNNADELNQPKAGCATDSEEYDGDIPGGLSNLEWCRKQDELSNASQLLAIVKSQMTSNPSVFGNDDQLKAQILTALDDINLLLRAAPPSPGAPPRLRTFFDQKWDPRAWSQ